MGFFELFGIAVGLSMDAFAVAICKGLGMKKINKRHAIIIALFFGVFQALMPVIGWALGTQFERFIAPIDHWIAFGLLAFIGGKMLWDALCGSDADGDSATSGGAGIKLDYKELVMLALATSIDALAIGITFAFLHVDIVPSASLIGVITFALSLCGVVIGNRFGARFEKPATIVGGVVLVLIGLKILLEHMGVLMF